MRVFAVWKYWVWFFSCCRGSGEALASSYWSSGRPEKGQNLGLKVAEILIYGLAGSLGRYGHYTAIQLQRAKFWTAKKTGFISRWLAVSALGAVWFPHAQEPVPLRQLLINHPQPEVIEDNYHAPLGLIWHFSKVKKKRQLLLPNTTGRSKAHLGSLSLERVFLHCKL